MTTDHRHWRDGWVYPAGGVAPEDATWTFGVSTAGPPDPTSEAFLKAPTTAGLAHPAAPADASAGGQPAAGQGSAGGAGQQIVFIEGSVADCQVLADGVQPGVTAVILDPSANGVQQIADYLQQHQVQNLAAISIVTDGADGELQLGSALLRASNVATYQPQLAAIGAALAPGGDLLLYGCDVAQNSAGGAFLGDLAAATGVANIAAASHVVGAAADGGSFNLDVDLGTAATAPIPFTPATVAAYPDLLGIPSNLVWYITDSPTTANTGVYTIDVNAGTIATNPTDINSTPAYTGFVDLGGLAIDPVDGHYFVANYYANAQGNDVNQIFEGNTSGNGTPTAIYTSGNSGEDAIVGLAFDQVNDLIYMAVTDANIPGTNSDTGIYTISALGIGTRSATELVNLGTAANAPNNIAIDTTHNLLFYTNGVPGLSDVEEVGVANLSTGAIINADLVSYAASGNQQPYGIAVNPATDTLYWTTVNFTANSGNAVYSATYAANGATLSNTQTLATTSQALVPIGIGLDVPQGGYYVDTLNQANQVSAEVLFGSSLTTPETLTKVYSVPLTDNGTETLPTEAIVVETQPTVTASGTVTYADGQAAVRLDASATVPADADGDYLASATLSIASGMGTGDTLNFTNQNGISGNYSSGTLTLTGVATEATYATALQSVTFSTTSTSAAARTIDWTVSDGVVTSPTTTSTVDVHVAPTITAGATATFDGGGSPVVLDSGLTVTDASSTTLAGATIVIVGSITADRLNFVNQNNISGSYNAATGTLVLSGVDSVGHYQTALESISYSVSPNNSDPTGGGGDTSRTIDWSVTDGVLNSGTVTSTVNTVHVKPTLVAGATATFDGGTAPVVLDSGVMVSDPDSGGVLSSAVVMIAGAITGDTLNFTNTNGVTEGNISVVSDSGGVLRLSSTGTTATLAQWQTALEAVTYSFSPSNGDPTAGGSDTSRTIDWVVNDGSSSNGTSSTGTSTLDTVHVAPTVTAGGSVTYRENDAQVVLDPTVSVSDPDSGGNLVGASVTLSGVLPTDSLNFSNQNGISGSYADGVLTLTGTSSLGNYNTALESVTYSNSGDPTDGNTDNSRTVSWVANDVAADSAAAHSALETLCFCADTRIATPTGEVVVQRLAVGDAVLTACGAARKIVWIGVGRVLVRRGRRSAATPVIVRRGALARNVPHCDLRVSKGHALCVDEVLIPVEFLVNHRSILWDDRAQEVALYHVELETHDVLLANGAPAESYRDDGNRWLFQNANSGWGLPALAPCRPVLSGGPIVDAAWRRLLDRAGPRPGVALTDDPDLHLVVDGKRIDPLNRHSLCWSFRLTGAPREVRIRSNTVVPAELGLARDPRPLGVAIRRIAFRQRAEARVLEAASPQLAVGFHMFEPDNLYRWTDGDALVPSELFASARGPFMLQLEVGEIAQYPLLAAA